MAVLQYLVSIKILASARNLAKHSAREDAFPIFRFSHINKRAWVTIQINASFPSNSSFRMFLLLTLGSVLETSWNIQFPISYECEHRKKTCSWSEMVLAGQENLQMGELLPRIAEIWYSQGKILWIILKARDLASPSRQFRLKLFQILFQSNSGFSVSTLLRLGSLLSSLENSFDNRYRYYCLVDMRPTLWPSFKAVLIISNNSGLR